MQCKKEEWERGRMMEIVKQHRVAKTSKFETWTFRVRRTVDSVFGRLWPIHRKWNLGVGHKCLIGGNVGVEYPDFNLPTPN